MEVTEKFQVLLDLLEMDAVSAKSAIVSSAAISYGLNLSLHLIFLLILIFGIRELHKSFNILNGYKEAFKFISTRNDKLMYDVKDTELVLTKKEVMLFIKYSVLVIALIVVLSSGLTHFFELMENIIGLVRCYVSPDTVIMEYIKDVLQLA